MSITYREYQLDAIGNTLHLWQQGYRDLIGIAATGAGKTVIFAHLIEQCINRMPSARVVVLAHREELLHQPREKMLANAPEFMAAPGFGGNPRLAILSGASKTKIFNAQITIASVQTLGRPATLAKLLANGSIDYLIIDEAHHAAAPSYIRVIDGLKQANAELRMLGVTATPNRSDGIGMGSVFEAVAFKYDINYLIKLGYLVKPMWYAVDTQISLSSKIRMGDFEQGALARDFENEHLRATVVATHQRYSDGKKAIAFCVSREGARKLAEAFRHVGYRAAFADGETPAAERAQLLRDYAAGHIDILANCALWTEGLDLPMIETIHMARPTSSEALYLQMVGRGLRPFGDKQNCLVFDYMPKDDRSLTLGSVLGSKLTRAELLDFFKKPEAKEIGGDELEQLMIGAEYNGDHFVDPIGGINLDNLSIELRLLNYLEEESKWNWFKRGNEMLATVGLGKGQDGYERILLLDGGHTLYGIARKANGEYWQCYKIDHSAHIDVLACAEHLVKQHGTVLAKKKQAWHNNPASVGQMNYLLKIGRSILSKQERDDLRYAIAGEPRAGGWQPRSGEAAQLINHAIALKEFMRYNQTH